MSRELRQEHTRELRAEYIIIEEAARILREIIDVLPESRSMARLHLSIDNGQEPASEDLRKEARVAVLKELLEFLDSELNPPSRPRPRLVPPSERAPALQLTYQQFATVLREWDVYTFLELNEMSSGFWASILASRLAGDDYIFRGEPEIVRVKLSDLAGLLWKSLEAGPGEADRIHDEFFAEEQAQHFKEMYESPEHIARALRGEYGRPSQPTEMFVKLGRPAQIIVVRDSILQRSMDNYERGVSLKNEQEEAERLERKRLSEERRKTNEAVRRMRELDKSQCVFCGKKLSSHLSYVRLTAGAYEVLERRYAAPDSARFNADDVMLCCMSCASRLNGRTPEDTGMTPTFGRFLADDVTKTT